VTITEQTGSQTRPSHAWPTYPDLAGKVAVVTGGSRGLGAAACHALGANGVKVAVNGRDESAIAAVVSELTDAGGDAMQAPADCTDAAALETMRDRVNAEFGPVDVLLAFAGGGRQPQPLAEIDEGEWRTDLERNLTATFLTIKTFLPAMVSRGAGSIITMASVAARLPGGAPIAYAAAKAGIIVLSQQVAKEAAPSHVRLNCLAPSTVVNERMHEAIPEEQLQQMATMYPLGRLGVPNDVADASLFLASEASSWITGVTLDIAGGQVMS
jgi:3-oxoacyl-[acyl-carrier protein] reductase